MGKFRQFLAEVGLAAGSLGGNQRSAIWGLPFVTHNAAMSQRTPAGGFQSFAQGANFINTKINLNDPDFIEQTILQKLAEFAESAAAIITEKQSGRETGLDNRFKAGPAMLQGRRIVGLSASDITSRQYPRIHPNEFDRAKTLMKIFVPSLIRPGLLDMDIAALETQSKNMIQKMSKKLQGQDALGHLAGAADNALSAAASGGQIGLSHGANPFSGS